MSSDMNILNLLETGINAEGTRQQAIANNIANINTQGYRRQDIRFEEVLAKALETNKDIEVSELKAELYRPMTTTVNANGNDVALDAEVGEMVKNSLKHRTYALLLKKKYRQLTEAITLR